MTNEERKYLEGRIRNSTTDAQLEAEMHKWSGGSEQRRMVRDALVKRRAEASPSYEQKERHHGQLIWYTLIAAVIGALIGAAATSWFSSRGKANGMLQPAPLAIATPAPSPIETPAAATP